MGGERGVRVDDVMQTSSAQTMVPRMKHPYTIIAAVSLFACVATARAEGPTAQRDGVPAAPVTSAPRSTTSIAPRPSKPATVPFTLTRHVPAAATALPPAVTVPAKEHNRDPKALKQTPPKSVHKPVEKLPPPIPPPPPQPV